jgi:hypothetical protein
MIHQNDRKRRPKYIAYTGEIRDAYKILATEAEK